MIVAHNLPALRAGGNLRSNGDESAKTAKRLASGLRINSAADDAAGLAISEKMRAQIRGLDQAKRNTQDGISLIQTAEGALGSIGEQIHRLQELATQSANGTYSTADRQSIQKEVNQIKASINQVASSAHFNGLKLIDGSLMDRPAVSPTAKIDVTVGGSGKGVADGEIPLGPYGAVVKLNPGEFITSSKVYAMNIDWVDGKAVAFDLYEIPGGVVVAANQKEPLSVNGMTFDVSRAANGTVTTGNQHQGVVVCHPGNNSLIPEEINAIQFQIGANGGQTLSLTIDNYSLSGLNLTDLAMDPASKAEEAITQTKQALAKVLSGRANLGAIQNRLEHTLNNLGTTFDHLTAAESRIRDADIAKEMMQLTKQDILTQAAQAMLAQANQQPQGILQLLK